MRGPGVATLNTQHFLIAFYILNTAYHNELWLNCSASFFSVAILSVHIGFAALSGGLILKGYNLFPVNFETLPMELKEGPWLKRSLAWEYRNEYEGR